MAESCPQESPLTRNLVNLVCEGAVTAQTVLSLSQVIRERALSASVQRGLTYQARPAAAIQLPGRSCPMHVQLFRERENRRDSPIKAPGFWQLLHQCVAACHMHAICDLKIPTQDELVGVSLPPHDCVNKVHPVMLGRRNMRQCTDGTELKKCK